MNLNDKAQMTKEDFGGPLSFVIFALSSRGSATIPRMILRAAFILWLLVAMAGCAPRSTSEAIRWGADTEGGAPYVFPPEDDPRSITGFEVDLAEALGRELGKPMQFSQQSWDSMLLTLHRGDIDVTINGYEYTPDRAHQYLASRPYYIYELTLTVKRDSAVKDWDQFRKPKPGGGRWKIGVLETSAADRYATEQFGEHAEILRYAGVTESFADVHVGRLDGTVQDWPAAQYYINVIRRYPDLHLLGERVAPGYYVMYARPGDQHLVDELNAALERLNTSGQLRTIYAKYGLWNETQSRLPDVWRTWPPKDELEARKWQILSRQLPMLVQAAGNTVLLSVLSMPLAVLIGLIAALCRTWHTPALGGTGRSGWGVSLTLRSLFTFYVEVVRGTPLAFQLFAIYFVLPEFGVTVDPFTAGVIALAVNYSAYEAEIIRLGIQAIPRGQMEAAVSLGMSRALAVRRIVLPQAVRMVIPATANDFIALFKDTAVCSVIAVPELAKQYSLGAKTTGFYLEMAFLASVLYLAMSIPLSFVAAWIERRMKRH